jgi:hypothetical protein
LPANGLVDKYIVALIDEEKEEVLIKQRDDREAVKNL